MAKSELLDEESTKGCGNGSDFIAEFPMAYTLTNRKGTNSGTLQMTLRLRSQAQTWEIIAIQKKVIQAK